MKTTLTVALAAAAMMLGAGMASAHDRDAKPLHHAHHPHHHHIARVPHHHHDVASKKTHSHVTAKQYPQARRFEKGRQEVRLILRKGCEGHGTSHLFRIRGRF